MINVRAMRSKVPQPSNTNVMFAFYIINLQQVPQVVELNNLGKVHTK